MKPLRLVVGLDPGKYWGISILSLDGKLLSSETLKNPKKHEIIEHIMSFGSPVLFGVDVRKVPSSVHGIAASFGCRVVSPKEDMKVSEKEETGKEGKDDHQRDSLAAARFALEKASDIYRKAVGKSPEGVDPEAVAELVLRGEASSISKAIEMLMPERKGEIVYVKTPMETRLVASLKAKLKKLEEELSFLRERNRKMEETISQLKRKLMSKKRKVERIHVEIRELDKPEGLVEVVRLPDYTRKTLMSVDIRGKVVLVENPVGSEKLLAKMGPKLVLSEGEIRGVLAAQPKEFRIVKKLGREYLFKDELEKWMSKPETLAKRMKL